MRRIDSRTVEFTTAAEQLAADYLDQEFDKGKGYPEAARSALEGAAATLSIPVGSFTNEFVSYLSDGTLVLVGGQRSLNRRRLVSSGNYRPTLDEMPMGGCSTARAHYAHLAAGDPKCENQR